MTEAKYLSPKQAAKKLGIHAETMRRALRDEKVPGSFRTPGGQWKVPEAYVVAVKGSEVAEDRR